MSRLEYSKPPESLAAELREVATDAKMLADEIGRMNRLPADFPAEAIKDLLGQLNLLPSLTAEGCRIPLEYARQRLPELRRAHILTEEQSRAIPADGEHPPPLTRGMTIDNRFTALIASVATALDEYRRLASEAPANETDTSPSLELDPASPNRRHASERAHEAEQILEQGEQKLEAAAAVGSRRADDLRRQMRDAKSRFRLSRIELRMPSFIPRWYERIVESIRDYPTLIEQSAKALQRGSDIAEAAYRTTNKFADSQFKSITDTVRHAAYEMAGLARKWREEAATRGVKTPADLDEQDDDFDPDAVRAMILRGEAPPTRWIPRISDLNFILDDLSDLTPIAGLSALKSLDLMNTQVSDLTPIAGLAALERLDLNGTQVSDLTPIAGLAALERLDLMNTQVSDLTAIAGLAALERLDLINTKVSDLTPIAGLAALEHLDLMNTQVSDLTPIAGLLALEHLDLNGTQVSDLKPIEPIVQLKSIIVSSTAVKRRLARGFSRPDIIRVSSTKRRTK